MADRFGDPAPMLYLRRRPRAGRGRAPAGEVATGTRPAQDLHETRRARGRLLLTEEITTATLDRRQSAIGALSFELVGSPDIAAMWELQDSTTGVTSSVAGERLSPEFGRRPIVQHERGRLVIGLRHVHELRRLVVLIQGVQGTDPHRLIGTLYGGSIVDTSFVNDGPVIAALAIYQVDGELVVRREGFDFATRAEAVAAYGFHLTWVAS